MGRPVSSGGDGGCARSVAQAQTALAASLQRCVQPAPERLANLARGNHGVFLTADAEKAGLSSKRLRRLVSDGWCERLGRGVYRVTAVPRTSAQAIAVALSWHGSLAVVSHRTAAWAWRLPGFTPGRRPAITLPPNQNRRSTVADLHVCLLLPPEHLVVHAGFPTTSVARTLFDLVSVASPWQVEVALDHALSRRLCTLVQVQAVLFRLARPGREGSTLMRGLLDERGLGWVAPASELERRARAVFTGAGLANPEFEVNLGGGDWVGRVDCLWREARLVVELDGRAFHDGRTARAADRRRDNQLMSLGWRVLRFDWEDINRRPEIVVATIRRALDG